MLTLASCFDSPISVFSHSWSQWLCCHLTQQALSSHCMLDGVLNAGDADVNKMVTFHAPSLL